MTSSNRIFAFASLFFASSCLTTPAATATWTGAFDNNWFTAANWSPAAVPTASSNVSIGAQGTRAIIANATTTVDQLTVNGGGSRPLTFQSGGHLIVNGNVTVASVFGASGNIDLGANGMLEAGGMVKVGPAGILKGANGLLQGNGSVTGPTVIYDSGKLAPGTGGGLTVHGDVTFYGVASFDVIDAAHYSQLVVADNGLLNYGSSSSYLLLNFAQQITTTTSYHLFDFTQQTGNFTYVRLEGVYGGGSKQDNNSIPLGVPFKRTGSVWSVTTNGTAFVFDQATGNLTVTVPTPIFNTTLPDKTYYFGDDATFTVNVSSYAPATLQWQRQAANTTGWVDLADDGTYSGATTASLGIANVTLAMAGDQFRCVATNPVGTSESNAATLTVTGITVVAPPANLTVTPGATANFNVEANSTVPISYRWYILEGNNQNPLYDGGQFSGAATANLTIANVSAAMSGDRFWCWLIIANGNLRTTEATLTVATAAPLITSQPDDATVAVGDSANFTVTASGIPAPTFHWQYLPPDALAWVDLSDIDTVSGAETANLTVSSSTLGYSGDQFRCVVVNDFGTATSDAATLMVIPPDPYAPFFTRQPEDLAVFAGAAATFGAKASAYPAATYQWQRLPAGSLTWGNISDDSAYSGSTSANLTIASATLLMSGDQFACLATNSAGNVTSEVATLTVTAPPPVAVAPSVGKQPGNQKVTAGSVATFSVAADGSPTPSYHWQRKVAGSSTWQNLGDNSVFAGTTTAQLNVTAAVAMSGDRFRCVLSNTSKSVTSEGATLTVTAAPVRPVIKVQPQKVSATAGATIHFSVSAVGTPPLSYQWQRNNLQLKNGGRIAGATSTTLTIRKVAAGDTGTYRVIVSNLVSNVASDNVQLKVKK